MKTYMRKQITRVENNPYNEKIIIGGVVYGIAELSFTIGKGKMLSILRTLDYSAPEAIKVLSEDDNLKLKFIAWIGKQDSRKKTES